MTAPEIAAFEKKIDDVLGRLKDTNDPAQKRILLKQMRMLMSELDKVVFDRNRLPRHR